MTPQKKREILGNRYYGKCFICGKPLPYTWQMAHIIGNTKLNRKLYGDEIVDSIYNVRPTCSLECNAKVDIGRTSLIQQEIVRLVDTGDWDGIDEVIEGRKGETKLKNGIKYDVS